MYRLSCKVQKYDWGKVGNDSKVAQLSSNATHPQLSVEDTVPYAELWMGTHPNAPSCIYGTDRALKDVLAARPELLGERVSQAYGGDLPFLFKVLSVNKALSIQAHPDKALAQQLHARSPDVYKDPNHKPEMCVALTPFEGLCGFRKLEEIQGLLEAYPEFLNIFEEPPPPDAKDERTMLKALFGSLMRADPERVKMQLTNLVERLRGKYVSAATTKAPTDPESGSIDELILRLDGQFPGDVGCFCVLLLNYVKLEPGEAFFMAANEPHAYLSGDCVECMATSDNVVRAGLTPKFKDVETLIEILTYNSGPGQDAVMKGDELFRMDNKTQGRSVLYKSPIPEFKILRSDLREQEPDQPAESLEFSGFGGPSILIVTEGDGKMTETTETGLSIDHDENESLIKLQAGVVVFIGANVPVKISTDNSLQVYRAYSEK